MAKHLRVFFKVQTGDLAEPRSRTYANMVDFKIQDTPPSLLSIKCAPAPDSDDRAVQAFVPLANIDHFDIVEVEA
jgi:hypothetical protein